MREPLRVERHNAVTVFTLDRPKVNAIDAETSRLMGEQFAAFSAEADARVAVVTGAGTRIFSAGWDLKAAAAGAHESDDYGLGGFAGILSLIRCNKPVIAAVNGIAIGGGVELVLACDLVVAGRHTTFSFPEASLGNVADAGGTQLLPRRIPRALALELLYTGRAMPAAEAHRWGLVNNVVDSGTELAMALRIAGRIAEGAPLSLQATKELVRGTARMTEEQALTISTGDFPVYTKMLASLDHAEGPRAFAEKRVPRWQGR